MLLSSVHPLDASSALQRVARAAVHPSVPRDQRYELGLVASWLQSLIDHGMLPDDTAAVPATAGALADGPAERRLARARETLGCAGEE